MQAVISLVLLLAGGFFTWELLVGPAVDVVRATGWVETPCRIVDASVATSEPTGPPRPFIDRRPMLHSFEVSFRYEAGGKVHVSRSYSFAKNVRTSGSRLARRIVALYPSGREATCFVNPKDPAEAVVNRRFQGSMLLGLAPFLLFLVGFFGLTGTLFEGSGESRPRSPWRRKRVEGGPPARPLGEHWVNGQIATVGFAGLALFGLLAAIGSEVSNLAYLAVHFAVVALLAAGYQLRSLAASAALAGYALLLSVGWVAALVAPDGTSTLLDVFGAGDSLVQRLPAGAAAYATEVSPIGFIPPVVLVLVALGARRLYLDRPAPPVGVLAAVVVATALPAILVLDPSVREVSRRTGLSGAPPKAESLLENLGSGEPSRVERACAAIQQSQSLAPDLVPALVRAAEGTTGSVRATCLLALQFAGPGGRAAEEVLLASLRDPDGAVLHAAASALGALAPHLDASRVVPALASVAPGGAPPARRTVAASLGKLGPAAASAVPALAGLLGDADAEVREAAVRSLGELGPLAAPATAGLARLVDGPGARDTRRTAAETLGKIGPPAWEALPALFRFHASSDPGTRGAVLIAVASIAPESEEVVDLLAKATADPDTVGSVYLAFRGIGPRGAPAVPRLVQLLASPDAETRERACDALGAIGPGASAALPKLRELVPNPGPGPEGVELATAASDAIRKIEAPAAEAAGASPAQSPTARAPSSR